MGDLPDDVIRQLGLDPSSQEAKIDNFETSSVAAVLKQIGWPQPKISSHKAELGPGFSWDWFNSLALVGARCGSTREFRFRFVDLVVKPSGHEITEAFKAFKGDSKDPCCLIFHVFDHGRWVATNLQTSEDSSIHCVTRDCTFNVLPFTEFFQNRWRQDEC